MGDPQWGVSNPMLRENNNVAITTTLDPASGEVTTVMRSPRRGGHGGIAVASTAQTHHGLANELKVLADLRASEQLSAAEYETCKATIIARHQNDPKFDPLPALTNNDYEVSPDASPARLGFNTFTLLMCAEVYGTKVNLELEFQGRPTIAELRTKAQMLFQQETDAAGRDNGVTTDVVLSRLQVFNDAVGTWCDLITQEQLRDFVQLYAFQADNMWQTPGPAPSAQDIPAPRMAKPAVPRGGGGARLRIVSKNNPVPLRDGPSDASPAILWLPDASTVTAMAPSDGVWQYIEADNHTGYIDVKYLVQIFAPTPSPAPLPAPAAAPIGPIAPSHPIIPVANPNPNGVNVSVSAHIYGAVATVSTVVDVSGGLDALKRHLERCLVDEAKKRCLSDVRSIADHVWTASVVAKLVQRHDPNVPGWVDLTSMTHIHDGVNLFVQLTTSRDRPAESEQVLLAPGHAPELLSTGCLKHGEVGTITVLPIASGPNEQAVLPITVCGPRGDTFVYFKDDLMILSGPSGASGGRLQQEIEELLARKAAAVEAEDFLAAKDLKEQVAVLQEAQRQEQELLAVRAEPYDAKLKQLEHLKLEAIAAEDYAEAKVLKEQIDELKILIASQPQQQQELPLPDQLRRGMSHVTASVGLMRVAETLHVWHCGFFFWREVDNFFHKTLKVAGASSCNSKKDFFFWGKLVMCVVDGCAVGGKWISYCVDFEVEKSRKRGQM